MQCRDFQEIADSYLNDELLIETNHDVIRHLENCAACRHELAARREVRAKLRAAFTGAEELRVSDAFAANLRARLKAVARQDAPTPVGNWLTWSAIAACLIIVAGVGFLAVRQRQTPTPPVAVAEAPRANEEAAKLPAEEVSTPVDARAAASTAVAEIAKIAAGDHRDCAVNYRLPEAPIELEEAGRKYDRAYLNLTHAVMSQHGEFTGQLELIEAHSCIFEGRRFGHLALKHHGRLVSVLVTDVPRPTVSATTRDQSGVDPHRQVVSCSGAEEYRVSCFETARHAAFVVSDLTEAENLAVARALAPSVYEHIVRAEGLAYDDRERRTERGSATAARCA